MPADLSGTWNLLTSDNFEGYMLALGTLRCPVPVPAASMSTAMPKCAKCDKEVYFTERVTSLGKDWHRPCLKCEKCGKTLTFGGLTEHEDFIFESGFQFAESKEFLSLVTWDNDRLTCIQKGEKKNRGWTHWLEGDKLHLEMFCEGQLCKQTFQRA
ncbi:PREDICTED: retinoid-binding protein 7 [Elephantulus edwardii]|uniref:retinoid-binding protein 7 n=1 Tax=Elephantulus edwardii TaxID=28737 RepID=UPI0003F0B862|nr:PREDICTED: retinoid-binding protein 7 [Elephantulus edwardii]